jgi:alpha-beta hydrolase superfamily lysophospholipase
LERGAFQTREDGIELARDFGARQEQLTITSGSAALRASLVRAHDSSAAALLILHGNEETLSQWARAQAYLYREGISSLVVDYRGFGSSDGVASVRGLEQDALAAYRVLADSLGGDRRIMILGHEVGAALALQIAREVTPPPAGIILHGATGSLREHAQSRAASPAIQRLLQPDVWDPVAAARRAPWPLLVLRGSADTVAPQTVSTAIAAAAADRGIARLLILNGVTHDEIFLVPGAAVLGPIVTFARTGVLPVQALHIKYRTIFRHSRAAGIQR